MKTIPTSVIIAMIAFTLGNQGAAAQETETPKGVTVVTVVERPPYAMVNPFPEFAVVSPRATEDGEIISDGGFGEEASTGPRPDHPECLKGHCGVDKAVGNDVPIVAPCSGTAQNVRRKTADKTARVTLTCGTAIWTFDSLNVPKEWQCTKKHGKGCGKSPKLELHAGDVLATANGDGVIHYSLQRPDASGKTVYEDPEKALEGAPFRVTKEAEKSVAEENYLDEEEEDEEAENASSPPPQAKPAPLPPAPRTRAEMLAALRVDMNDPADVARMRAICNHELAMRQRGEPRPAEGWPCNWSVGPDANPYERVEQAGPAQMAKDMAGRPAYPLPFVPFVRSSQEFGPCARHNGDGSCKAHGGVDLTAVSGTPLFATDDGRIGDLKFGRHNSKGELTTDRGGWHFYLWKDKLSLVSGRIWVRGEKDVRVVRNKWLRTRIGYYHVPKPDPNIVGRTVRRGARIDQSVVVGTSGVHNSSAHLHIQVEVEISPGTWAYLDPQDYLGQRANAPAVAQAPPQNREPTTPPSTSPPRTSGKSRYMAILPPAETN